MEATELPHPLQWKKTSAVASLPPEAVNQNGHNQLNMMAAPPYSQSTRGGILILNATMKLPMVFLRLISVGTTNTNDQGQTPYALVIDYNTEHFDFCHLLSTAAAAAAWPGLRYMNADELRGLERGLALFAFFEGATVFAMERGPRSSCGW
jgi:hypothetical protein